MELYTPVLALMLLAAGFAIFSVIMSMAVGPRRYNRAKLDSYECGIEPTPQPAGGGRFPVKYYLTAMLFIVFDIEIVFLYPLAIVLESLGWFAVVELGVFIAVGDLLHHAAFQQERSRSERAGQRLQRLAQMMDVGVLLLSRDREVDFASARAAELFGLPPGASQGDWRPALEPLERILQTATAERTSGLQPDLEVGPPGKPRRIRSPVYLLDEEGTAGYLVQARDRDLLQAIETDLRLAAQLRALMRVYRGVAHDLRAPLNAMVLNLELLKRSLDPATPPRTPPATPYRTSRDPPDSPSR